MGHSKHSEGTSSGLHHDFHEVFYLVIRGSKTFTLFPPECVHDLYVYGNVSHVCGNGLICYGEGAKKEEKKEEKEPSKKDAIFREDGANSEQVSKWKERKQENVKKPEKMDVDEPVDKKENNKIRCLKCNEEMIESDWNTGNIELIGESYSHAQCRAKGPPPPTSSSSIVDPSAFGFPWKQQFVSTLSQYQLGATGSCTVLSLF